jgi:hypothetical protein
MNLGISVLNATELPLIALAFALIVGGAMAYGIVLWGGR